MKLSDSEAQRSDISASGSPPRFLPDSVLQGDPQLIQQGWERRFLADRHRAEEAIQLYAEMGYEVRAEPIVNHDLPEACEDCQLAVLLEFKVIYTRESHSKSKAP